MGSSRRRRFLLILIKPSHYDDLGYVIQWVRSAIPSNTLAVMNGLALECRDRRALGDDVDLDIVAYDETNTRIRPDRIARDLARAGGLGLVAFVGVQTNQFPRAMDLARRLRGAGALVCIGGFHVSGCLAMLPRMPPDLREALDLGISLFAGEAEGRFEAVLRDARDGALRPVYNFLDDLPGLEGAPAPMLPAGLIARTGWRLTSFDAGRGCPFQCSFCTIINVQGRKSRFRSADDVEAIVRANLAQGIDHFFVTDDDFARNRNWEAILDRLIRMREGECLSFTLAIQVDTLSHRIPAFVDKSARAGVTRVFLGIESINPRNLLGAKKQQNRIAEYRALLLAWKRAGCCTFSGYIIGFPEDTPETIARDIAIIQRELPLDLIEFFCLTPLPGSADHKKLALAGAPLDPDMNRYDGAHVCTTHPRMSKPEWERAYRSAWAAYYTPHHMATVMRRAAAMGGSETEMMLLLLWFASCMNVERIHPLEGGYLRRKVRTDRRPGLSVEPRLLFYPRVAAGLLAKHVRIAGLALRMARVRRQIGRDRRAGGYTDLALTDVAGDALGGLEMFQTSDAARAAARSAAAAG